MNKKTNLKSLMLSAVAATAIFSAPPSQAGVDPFVGEIIWVGFTYCPQQFAEANGQLLAISSNTALFSLLGTQYGGNGTTNFALPDLRGRSPVHVGQGTGLSNIIQGQQGGKETTALNIDQMPAHSHAAILHGTTTNGNVDSPAGALQANASRAGIYNNTAAANADMSASSITVANSGNNQLVEIRSPFLGIRACIALTGIFPSRN